MYHFKKIILLIFLIANAVIGTQSVFATTLTSSTTISSNTTYTDLVIPNGVTLTLNAELKVTGDLTVQNGGIITHPVTSSTNFNIIVDGTLDIQSGGKIDVNYKGQGSWGNGRGSTSSSSNRGGTYGGRGHSNPDVPYGNAINPTYVGSRGFNSGIEGGGLVRITAGNLINNGYIYANGEGYRYSRRVNTRYRYRYSSSSRRRSRKRVRHYRGGGASGGGMNINVTGQISGNGYYQANGGSGRSNEDGGGGGRIAIKYGTASDITTLKSKISASGWGYASNGTIYLKDNTTGKSKIIVKGTSTSTLYTDFIGSVNFNYVDEVSIENNSRLDMRSNVSGQLTNVSKPSNGYLKLSNANVSIASDLYLSLLPYFYVTGSVSLVGDTTISSTTTITGNFTVDGNLIVNSPLTVNGSLIVTGDLTSNTTLTVTGNSTIGGNATINSGTYTNTSKVSVAGDLTIKNGGNITHPVTSGGSFNLDIDGTLDIQSGGQINVNNKGSSTAGYTSSRGGSYGGQGWANSIKTYGDAFNPVHVGSYGNNSSYKGGGLVRIITGNLINNGNIYANGQAYSSGGGSGGGINITVTNNISGNGNYYANGGAGNGSNYGGGGGRIAIKYGSAADLTTLKARVYANGSKNVGNGTIYLREIGDDSEQYLFIRGDTTKSTNVTLITGDFAVENFKEIIVDNSNLELSGNITETENLWDKLILSNNSNLKFTNSGLSIDNTSFTGNGTIQTGSGVVFNNEQDLTLTNFIIAGDLNVGGNFEITGNLTVTGNSAIDGNAIINSGTYTNTSKISTTGDLTINSGGNITHPVTASNSFNLDIAGTLEIKLGGKIDVNYKGASSAGYSVNAGGTYGGQGRANGKIPYGNTFNPLNVGSYGKSSSYRGGGLVRIITGNLINNGNILSNGVSYSSGGGSGGGINITVTNNVSGNGYYYANGGTGNGSNYGGGGGRIAIKYGIASDLTTLKSRVYANGYKIAGNGTIYLREIGNDSEQYLFVRGDTTNSTYWTNITGDFAVEDFKEIIIDNSKLELTGDITETETLWDRLELSNNSYLKFTNSGLSINNTSFTGNGTIQTGGGVVFNNEQDLTLTNFIIPGDLSVGGDFTLDSNLSLTNLTVSGSFIKSSGTLTSATISTDNDFTQTSGTINNSGYLSIGGNFEQTSGTINNSGDLSVVGDFTQTSGTINNSGNLDAVNIALTSSTLTNTKKIKATGDLTINSGGNITHPVTSSNSFNLDIAGTLEIKLGGKIDVNYKGASSMGHSNGKGGSYGGQGRANSIKTYGNVFNPIDVGSYGNSTSYRGGGLVRIISGNLINNGNIYANGQAYSYGGGSGGGINITVTNNVSGNGYYYANGGSGNGNNYGGAGGRIAIKYGSTTDLTILKSRISANGSKYAGNGTIYLKEIGNDSEQYLFVRGDTTNSTYLTLLTGDFVVENFKEIIVDRSNLEFTGDITETENLWDRLELSNNSYLKFTNSGLSIDNTSFTGNGTIQTGGGVVFNNEQDLTLTNFIIPGDLSVGGDFTLASSLSLTNLTVSGSFIKNGGTLKSATISTDNDFTQTSGTINNSGDLSIGGNFEQTSGTINNSGDFSVVSDFTETGGTINNSGNLDAVNIALTSSTLTNTKKIKATGNLTINSGGNITHPIATTTTLFHLDVDGTLDIKSGGQINTNYKGNSSTGYTSNRGGSYGGQGRANGKNPYGDAFNPIYVGSLGYNSSYQGGGLVRITAGNLINNGNISSNGENYTYGGGSGGGINITVTNNVSGNGNYYANGGSGNGNNYGGGGGRIAIKYGNADDLPTLKSKISANGYKNAGNGTIYLREIGNDSEQYLFVRGDSTKSSYWTHITGNFAVENFKEIVVDNSMLELFGNITETENLWDRLVLSNNSNLKFTNSGLNIDNTSFTGNGTIQTGSGVVFNNEQDLTLTNFIIPGDLSVGGDFTLTSSLSLTNLTVSGSFIKNSGTLTSANISTDDDFTQTSGIINNSGNFNIGGDFTETGGSINNSGNLDAVNIALTSSTLTNKKTIKATGDLTINSGGNITHPVTSSNTFNLDIDGTLDIKSGGQINVNYKGASSTGYTSNKGGSYGGQGRSNSKLSYGSPYAPMNVGSYGGGTNYQGGGLVRVKTGNLINNGNIYANGENCNDGGGSGGGINITVTNNLSGNGSYYANGGVGNGSNYGGGGGRVAIQYGSVEDIDLLKSKISANGYKEAGNGTIYLNETGAGSEQYLIVKGDTPNYRTVFDEDFSLESFTEIIIDNSKLDLSGNVTDTEQSGEKIIVVNNGNFKISNSPLNINSTSFNLFGTFETFNDVIFNNDMELTADNFIVHGDIIVKGDFTPIGSYTINGDTSVAGDFNFNSSTYRTNLLSVSGSLIKTGGTINAKNIELGSDLTQTAGTINNNGDLKVNNITLTSSTLNNTGDVNSENVTLTNSTLNNTKAVHSSGSLTINSGGNITHPRTNLSLFHLDVDGILDIKSGGQINVNYKGASSTGAGGSSYGASYGGQGRGNSTRLPYGDVYGPIHVGSYGYNTSYEGGGLVRITAGTLINNGNINANGQGYTRGGGSGGGINISVANNISGIGNYAANGGTGNGSSRGGGGGRVAIQYGSVDDIDVLRSKISANGYKNAGEGTIYLNDKSNITDQYLIIKGDGSSYRSTIPGEVDLATFKEIIVDNSRLDLTGNGVELENSGERIKMLNNSYLKLRNSPINFDSSSLGFSGDGTLEIYESVTINNPLNLDIDNLVVHGNFNAEDDFESTGLITINGNTGIKGDFIINSGTYRTKLLTTSGSLTNNGGTLNATGINTKGNLIQTSGVVNNSGDTNITGNFTFDNGTYNTKLLSTSGSLIKTGGTINTTSIEIGSDLTQTSGTINNTGDLSANNINIETSTLTSPKAVNATGNLTIKSGGNITYPVTALSLFHLNVDGTLDIQSGGKIDVNYKGVSTLGSGKNYDGGSYGGQGHSNSKLPYGDLYSPIHVGSYGYSNTIRGGGLVRITAGNLINNGYVYANGASYSGGGASGGGINITVPGYVSGDGIYQANGGSGNGNNYGGGGGRIAIKYGTLDDYENLKSKISANGYKSAGEGSIYLAEIGNIKEQYLIINGDGDSYRSTIPGEVNLDNFKKIIIDNSRLDLTGDGTKLENAGEKLIMSNNAYLRLRNSPINFDSSSLGFKGDGILEIYENVILDNSLDLDIDNLVIHGNFTANDDFESTGVFTIDGDTEINGDFIINGGIYTTKLLTLSGSLTNSGATLNTTGINTKGNLIQTYGEVNNSGNTDVTGDFTFDSGTYNTKLLSTSGSLIKNGGNINTTSIEIGNDLIQKSGTITNIGDLSADNISIETSTLISPKAVNATGDLTIKNGGVITYPVTALSLFHLNVDGTLNIQSGGKIDASNKGISTLGSGKNQDGGSYGGQGHSNSKLPYGDLYSPIHVGSYGYNTSIEGGGLIRITAGNLVNNGFVYANGDNYTYGGGSGGGINITVSGDVSGDGTYQANGGMGNGDNYGGGGGRVAIKYGTLDNYENLKSKISANGYKLAGEGSIYLAEIGNIKEQYLIINGDGDNYRSTIPGEVNLDNFKEIVIDNSRLDLTGDGTKLENAGEKLIMSNNSYLRLRNSTINFDSSSLAFSGKGVLEIYENVTLTNPLDLDINNLIIHGDLTANDNFTSTGLVTVDGNTNIDGDFTINGGTYTTKLITLGGNLINSGATLNTLGIDSEGDLIQTSGTITNNGDLNAVNVSIENSKLINTKAIITTGDLTIKNGGIITHPTTSTSLFNLDIAGTLEIEEGGKIDVNYKGGSATGAGGSNYGASYGGQGESNGLRLSYGDIYAPIYVGSYGYTTWVEGGGLVRINALNLINDGNIYANGESYTHGGGSGGGINIKVTNNISGDGYYYANGGSGNGDYDGGAGGRIAIKYGTVEDISNLKSKVFAIGYKNAGEGTIYLNEIGSTTEQYLIIKGDGSSYWSTIPGEVNLDNFKEIIVDNSKLDLTGDGAELENSGERIKMLNNAYLKLRNSPINFDSSSLGFNGDGTLEIYENVTINNPLNLDIDNLIIHGNFTANDDFESTGLITVDGNTSIDGDFNLNTGTYSTNNLSVSGSLVNSGAVLNSTEIDIRDDFTQTSGSTQNTGNLKATNINIADSILSNAKTIETDGHLTINSGGNITHPMASISLFNLNIDGTLEVKSGGQINVSSKSTYSAGAGGSGFGGSYGGQGDLNTVKLPYGDVYTPIHAGSYGYNSSVAGGGFARIIAGSLINDGSIFANGANNLNGGASGGAINIDIEQKISGNGNYYANGGTGNGEVKGGGGGRISIKFTEAENIINLINNSFAYGYKNAGEGTIYLYDKALDNSYLIIKGDGSNYYTPILGNLDLNDFEKIQVTNSKLELTGGLTDSLKDGNILDIDDSGDLKLSFPGGVNIEEGMSLGEGTFSINGNLNFKGDADLQNTNLIVDGNLLFQGGLNLYGDLTVDGDISVDGDFNFGSGSITAKSFYVKGDFNNTSGDIDIITSGGFNVNGTLDMNGGNINNPGDMSFGGFNLHSGTITNAGSLNIYNDGYLGGGSILSNDKKIIVGGNFSIGNGGLLTHGKSAKPLFGLHVNGKLDIEQGGQINTDGKGISTLGSGEQYLGGTHGGYGNVNSKAPYGDVYDPKDAGSYGYNEGCGGGGLIKIIATTLHNNGSISVDGKNCYYAGGSGGGINLIIEKELSGTGTYSAKGGIGNGDNRGGGGGRIALKYGTLDDLDRIKSNIFVSGGGKAGNGTIYLKDNTLKKDYLLVDGTAATVNGITGVGEGYDDYYFDVIESTDGSKINVIGFENISTDECIVGGNPVGFIGSNITCDGANFKVYDLSISVENFSNINRKYEVIIEGTEGGLILMGEDSNEIFGNDIISKKIKITKSGDYSIKVNLYNGDTVDSTIIGTAQKNIRVVK